MAMTNRLRSCLKPIYQKLTTESEDGVVFKAIRGAGFNCPWHIHPEYELILVIKANGHRIVGDSISTLSAGDLVFVGPGLPHIWQNENSAQQSGQIHALLIQFEEKLLGREMLQLAALEPIRQLLHRAERGLHVTGATRGRISQLMRQMESLRGIKRIIQLFNILDSLSGSGDCHPIASQGFVVDAKQYEEERMDLVFQFLNGRIDQEVRLSEAARIIGLSEGAFSRFFRLHTGKTFPEFMNELRIGRACHLLTETDKTVTEVAYSCGFESLTNFNRQFLRIKRLRPRDFRKQMQQRIPDPASSQHSR